MFFRNHHLVYATSLFALVVLVCTAWLAYLKIQSEVKYEYKKSLDTILQTSHEAIKKWSVDIRKDVSRLAEHPKIREYTKELLKLPANRVTLMNSPIQAALRQEMSPFLSHENFYGFFIIGTDNINYASLRDENLGDINLLARQDGILEKAWSDETIISLPIPSDVPLPGIGGKLREGEPTMFVGASIKDESGKNIAILTFRINPMETFSKIFQRGRIGETGETYAFNENAYLISESRFIDDLRQIGLIAPEQGGILNIMLREPGMNLVKEGRLVASINERPLTFMVENALSGGMTYNLEGYNDYRGVPVVGVWLWDKDLNFGITTEVDYSEAYGFLNIFRGVLIVFSAIVAFLIVFLTVVFIVSGRKLDASQEQINSLLASTAEAIYGVDLEGVCTFCNVSCLKMLGYERKEDLLGQNMYKLTHDPHSDGKQYPKAAYQVCAVSQTGKSVHSDSEKLLRKDGTSFPVEYWSYPIMHKGKLVGYVVSFLDISERKHIQEALRLTNIELEEKNQRLNEIAMRDGLTGVANRRAFDDHLQAEWNRSLRNGDPISLIMLDIDYFKNYNDCYGHLAGDACLKRVADVLLNKGYTRRPGDLSARYGGEEFAIILSATDEIAASKIGKRICVDVAEMKIPNKEVPVIEDFNVVTISAGVASMVPQTGDTPDQLIKAADEALYYAKSQGRNRSVSRSDIPEEAIN